MEPLFYKNHKMNLLHMIRLVATCLIFLLLTAIPFNGFCQNKFQSESGKAMKFYQDALMYYRNTDFNKALIYINKAINEDKKFIGAYLLQADIQHELGDIKAEIGSYLVIKSIDSLSLTYLEYNLGLAYLDIGEYARAKNCFLAFKNIPNANKVPKDKIEKYIDHCDFAIELMQHPVPFEPQSLGSNLDLPWDEYWPSLPIDAKTLVFTMMVPDSNRLYPDGTLAFQEDFYITRLVNGIWQKPQPIGLPINTPGNEGAQQISADGSMLVFTGCNRKDGFGKCDIYFTEKNQQGNWNRPYNAGEIVNTSYSDKQPCLSPDGRQLYFSSDRPGGLGKMDIWVSDLDDKGKWKKPRNIGDLINTTEDDLCPFIHPDNQTLYFSSEGHPGMGKMDIYVSRRDSSGKWSKPVNIGYPINTYRNEIGLIVDHTAQTAYFSSDVNSKSKKIYTFKIPVESQPIAVSYVKGLVYDKETGMPLKAYVQLLDVYSGDTLMSVLTKEGKGDFLISLPVGKSYALHALSTGYLFHSNHFDLTQNFDASKPYSIDIPMEKPQPGANIVLQNIFFKTNSFELLPSSFAELHRMVSFINDNPNTVFEVGGHTDNTGNQTYNQQLSEKRAKAVYDYLISKNIPTERICYKGYGPNVPVETNETVEGRAANRRTELKIIEIR